MIRRRDYIIEADENSAQRISTSVCGEIASQRCDLRLKSFLPELICVFKSNVV